MQSVALIVAACVAPLTEPGTCIPPTGLWGIGYKGTLPWPELKNDMAWFRTVTSSNTRGDIKNVVIMGRKTYESLPPQFRPLPNRHNIVLTRSPDSHDLPPTVLKSTSLDHALAQAQSKWPTAPRIFIIGGSEIYKEALAKNICSEFFVTKIYKPVQCDAFIPPIEHKNEVVTFSSQLIHDNGTDLKFEHHVKHEPLGRFVGMPSKRQRPLLYHNNGEEQGYLHFLQDIIVRGDDRMDRTGTGSFVIFANMMNYDLRDGKFPLFTSKKVNFDFIFKEMMWMLNGRMNSEDLEKQGVNIWKANTSREALDKRGLHHLRVGDTGPGYGFNLRHFGAKYEGCDANYDGKGVDQLAKVIELIKKDDTSRRIYWNLWDPASVDSAALPQCHVSAQFDINTKGELSCKLEQRSCDMGMGVPFNVAGYALIVILLAHSTGLKPGFLHHSMGNAHVYKNHVGALFGQARARGMLAEFPTLTVKKDVDRRDVWDYKFEDLELRDYDNDTFINLPFN